METNWYERILLAVIAVFLGMVALRPLLVPDVARAQNAEPAIYIEPGVHTLRAPDSSSQVYGRVVVDLRTGKIYGFPTMIRSPYPVDNTSKVPPVSHPMYLGQFDFDAIYQPQR